MKKVAVIITTYKRPINVLKRALLSVKNQTYKDFDCIVVNDYPENKELSANIVQCINELEDERFKYVSYEKNRGACAARNFGVNSSKSEFISFLDDDDEWIETKLEKQLNGFNNSNIGLVYSPYFEYDEINNGVVVNQVSLEKSPIIQLLKYNFIGGCSMVTIRRTVFDELNGFDETLLASQDYDLWLRILKNSQISYVSEPLVKRFLSDDSISNNFTKKKQGWDRFFEKNMSLYIEHPTAYNYRLNIVSCQSIDLGQYKYAFGLWKRAVKVKPLAFKTNIKPVLSYILIKLRGKK